MMFLGIDPGASGGIAIINKEAIAIKMPETARDIWDFFSAYQDSEVYAVLEKVGGVVSSTADNKFMGASMFTFGSSYGMVYMALIAAKIPFDLAHPRTWQKSFNLSRMKGELHSKWKGRMKETAQRLFPEVRVTLATADALLLAEYARRSKIGTSKC